MIGAVIIGFLAILLFLISVIIMIAGGTGKSKRTIVVIVGCLAGSLILGSFSIYSFVTEINDRMSDPDASRTGSEIYEHFYGKPKYSCLQIISYADYDSPGVGRGTWLHFNTCPEEFERIIRQYNFGYKIDTSSIDWPGKPYENNAWFKPHNLGKQVLKFSFPNEPEPRMMIYTNLDSTEVYMVNFN